MENVEVVFGGHSITFCDSPILCGCFAKITRFYFGSVNLGSWKIICRLGYWRFLDQSPLVDLVMNVPWILGSQNLLVGLILSFRNFWKFDRCGVSLSGCVVQFHLRSFIKKYNRWVAGAGNWRFWLLLLPE